MTPEALVDAVRRAGVPDGDRLRAAADGVAPWLAGALPASVVAGLSRAADPPAALHALARLLETGTAPSEGEALASLLRVLGGSAAIAASLVAEGPDWPALFATVLDVAARDAAAHGAALAASGVGGPLAREDLQAALRRHRRRELVRIGGRDVLGLATVDDTVREISVFAAAVIEGAVASTRARLVAQWGEAWAPDAPGVRPAAFAVLGMGKLGGEELNYSSDIDLVYVYEADGGQAAGRTLGQFFTRLAEEVTRALREVTADGFVFRVDLRLRPGGGEGPVAVSLPAALSYYEAWGATWERAAWLKARPVAGDHALGARLLAELEPFIYRRFLDYATIEDLKAMKRKVDASLPDPDAARSDVKLGRGGIREIEFLVQAHQLVHGGKDPRVRRRATLAALAALADGGYVPPDEAAALAAAYRFLRDVEHKIQVVQGRQTQRIPREPDEVLALARRCGFLGADPAGTFWAVHADHTGRVRAAFDALFHGAEARRREEDPELAVLADPAEPEERILWRLGRLGFRDLESAFEDLRLLRDGPKHAPASARRRQALGALAPALLKEIAASADPDRALHHLATFISTVGARSSYLHLLLENPGVMQLLVRLFATSAFLSAFFLRHPELLDSLVRADLVRLDRSPAELEADLTARLAAAADDLEAELDTLRRFRHEEFLRIGVHDIQGSLALGAVGQQLTALAETCLRAALAIARRETLRRTGLPSEPPVEELVVMAMGKLGAADLGYASDLDIIFVYDPGDGAWWEGRPPAHEFFTRVAQRAISALQTPTREGMAYRIDTRLRPSGNQGPLVSSLAAFAAYHEQSAALWERQAMIKARVVAGPPALGARLDAIVAGFVYGRGLTPAEAAEVAEMRERIERERGAGSAHIKTGRGGLVDVEFLVQMLQLRHGCADPTLRVRGAGEALRALERAGILTAADARALGAGYDFLRAVESRLRLERDQPAEAIDEDREALRALARRLGYAGSDDAAVASLVADHARHREAIRTIYDRLFADAVAGRV